MEFCRRAGVVPAAIKSMHRLAGTGGEAGSARIAGIRREGGDRDIHRGINRVLTKRDPVNALLSTGLAGFSKREHRAC